jgi:hypothetical protein
VLYATIALSAWRFAPQIVTMPFGPGGDDRRAQRDALVTPVRRLTAGPAVRPATESAS